MNLILNLFLAFIVFFTSCRGMTDKSQTDAPDNSTNTPGIVSDIFNNQDSFYYIDFAKYEKIQPDLPIGVFDSGTGGLTVLDALLRFDQNTNSGLEKKADGLPDFKNEEFIYLADQANMPYGNYFSENKSDLLVEHIIKDTQFLLSKNIISDNQAR